MTATILLIAASQKILPKPKGDFVHDSREIFPLCIMHGRPGMVGSVTEEWSHDEGRSG